MHGPKVDRERAFSYLKAFFENDDGELAKDPQSNDWGLYCMPGNVFEWQWDFYAPYTREAQVNPAGPASSAERVTRGGNWRNPEKSLRIANRIRRDPLFRSLDTGFRLVCNGAV